MRLAADFIDRIEPPQRAADNDNRADELEFTIRNALTSALTNLLTRSQRVEGVS